MLPAGQVAVTDGSVGQPEGTEPGEDAFWAGPDPAGLCVAPGLTWFGAGLGPAAFWVRPTAWP
jgi:hypothetical protein